MGCEIQECGKYQPFRMFIENTLAVEITMTAVKTKAAIFMSKFGVKQHDKVLRKRMEMDEKGHNGRPPNYEKERREDLEKVGYYFIRINPDKIDFNDYEEFGRISSYIAKSTKKLLIDDLSKRFLGLKFEKKPPNKIEVFKMNC